MCRSVPQMAVFSTFTRTSLAPGEGTGTSSIQMPRAASRLTSARMVVGSSGVLAWGMDGLQGRNRETTHCNGAPVNAGPGAA